MHPTLVWTGGPLVFSLGVSYSHGHPHLLPKHSTDAAHSCEGSWLPEAQVERLRPRGRGQGTCPRYRVHGSRVDFLNAQTSLVRTGSQWEGGSGNQRSPRPTPSPQMQRQDASLPGVTLH